MHDDTTTPPAPALTPAQRVARHKARTRAAGGRRLDLLLGADDARLLAIVRERLGAPSDRAAVLALIAAAATTAPPPAAPPGTTG